MTNPPPPIPDRAVGDPVALVLDDSVLRVTAVALATNNSSALTSASVTVDLTGPSPRAECTILGSDESVPVFCSADEAALAVFGDDGRSPLLRWADAFAAWVCGLPGPAEGRVKVAYRRMQAAASSRNGD